MSAGGLQWTDDGGEIDFEKVEVDEAERQKLKQRIKALETEARDVFHAGKIDFGRELQKFEQRNQVEVPCTLTQIEDAIYLDQGLVLSLQYHIFNTRQKQVLLTESDACYSELGLDNYQRTGRHPASIFREKPRKYFDTGVNFLGVKNIGECTLGDDQEA